ncbi:hypothetical protein ACHAPJ_009464 [Fusarium lateritium]
MSEQRRDSIADDWLEVESAASVISLANSDDLSRPTSPFQQAPPQEPPVTTTSATTSAGPSHHEAHSTPLPIRLHRNNNEQTEPSSTPQQQLDSASPEQDEPEEQYGDDSITSETNPRDYHKACTAAIESLDALANSARELGGNRVSTLKLMHSTCNGLSTQAKELNKMLEAYAKYWGSKDCNLAIVDMPLTPNIWDWISDLRVQVLRAQGELRSLKPDDDATTPINPKNIPLHINLALASCLEALEDTEEVFSEFLPILKADFDEFQTQHMGFPKAQPTQARRESHREPPHPAVSRIRRELYALKDRIVMISVFLSRLKNAQPEPKLIEPQIFKSLIGIVETISTVLTNNPSDWIDSSTAASSQGTMSYLQFLGLDPEILHDVTSTLHAFQDELDIKTDQDAFNYTPEMIRNHQEYLLFEGGQLQELRGMIEFTEALLAPNA